MANRIAYQLLLGFVALASVDSKKFRSKSSLGDVFVSQPFQNTLYVITKQRQRITKEASRSVCVQLGGYLAKLGAGSGEFEHIRKSIMESGLKGDIFFIDEADRDAPNVITYSLRDQSNCTIFFKTWLRMETGFNRFRVIKSTPCNLSGYLICEVPIVESTTELSNSSTDPVGISQRFHISPTFQGRVYLASKYDRPFDIENANNDCRALGGYLWEIETKKEFDFVRKAFPVGYAIFFTGGHDMTVEGQFEWYNSGRNLSMTDGTQYEWCENQPDNYNNEDCVILVYTLKLNDYLCSGTGRYICEVPTDVNK